MYPRRWPGVWRESWGVSEENCFVCKFTEMLSLLTLPISALCYCTVFSVLLWMWHCVCLVCYCECGSPYVPVTAVSWMLSVSAQTLHAALYRHINSLLTWPSLGTLKGVLGAFAKFWTTTINFVVPDHPSLSMEEIRFYLMNFREILYLSLFSKIFQEHLISLKSEKNKRYITCRQIYIYNYISLTYFRVRNVGEKIFT